MIDKDYFEQKLIIWTQIDTYLFAQHYVLLVMI